MKRSCAIALVALGILAAAASAQEDAHADIIRALLERSRLLADARFTVPVGLYRLYLQETKVRPDPAAPPVALIADEGLYQVAVPNEGPGTLAMTLRLTVFRPQDCPNLPVLSDKPVWESVTVNGRRVSLAPRDGWLRFSPDRAGVYVVSAQAALAAGREGAVALDIYPSTRTMVRFDSPRGLDVTLEPDGSQVAGSAEKGAHARFALSPRASVRLRYAPAAPPVQRPPRMELRGDVAWTLDAGAQQVAANLTVAILGGKTDRLDLLLPPGAERVTVTGPEVREARVEGGSVQVFLRGTVTGQTPVSVRLELPAGGAGTRRLDGLTVRDGHWTGGTLIIGNALGQTEVLAGGASGLDEIPLTDAPDSAVAILPAPGVLAYRISGRSWSAAVESVSLDEFALRESIADLARFDLLWRPDGQVMVKAAYEVRNRGKQFLRLDAPAGWRVLSARVDDRPCPVSPAADAADAYLLPLVRSPASVQGLVSFPVEVVLIGRVPPAAGRGDLRLPLPRVDLPVAYAFCQAYLPDDVRTGAWSGPMQHVQRYSSETAQARLGYGRAERAQRPAPERPVVPGMPSVTAAPGVPMVAGLPPIERGVDGLEFDGGFLLSRNYYRAGRDFYDNNDFDKAAEAFRKVAELAPNSPEADNAERYLSNIRLARGEVLKSRAEQIAGREVQQKLAETTKELRQEQQQLQEEGLKAAREGQYEQARTQLKAAEDMGKKVTLLPEAQQDRQATFQQRQAQEELARLEVLNKQRLDLLGQKVEQLKKEGRYQEALSEANRLVVTSNGKVSDELLKSLDDLAVQAAKQQAAQGQGRGALGPQAAPSVLRRLVVADEALPPGQGQPGQAQPAPGPAPTTVQPGRGAPSEEPAAGRAARIIALRNAGAEEVAAALNQALGGAARPGAGPVRIAADARTNALIVSGSDEDLEQVAALVRQLDESAAAPRGGRAPAPQPAAPAAVDSDLARMSGRLTDVQESAVPGYLLTRYSRDWAEARLGAASAPALPATRPAAAAEPSAPDGTVTRVHDVRDLITAVPRFKGPTVDTGAVPANAAGPQSGLFGHGDQAAASQPAYAQAEEVKRLGDIISTVTADDGERRGTPAPQMREIGGQLVVTGTPEQQRTVEALVDSLRQVRGPQVELGSNIAGQRARGAAQAGGGGGAGGRLTLGGQIVDVPAAQSSGEQPADDPELRRFLEANYDWQAWRAEVSGLVLPQDLTDKLRANLGQKVPVSSVNINTAPAAAAALGIEFHKGNNDLTFAVIDEAQFRSLLEVESRSGRQAATGGVRHQDAIVGTDALLANSMVANAAFAADRGNTLDIASNAIVLAHERYVLINNGDTLTAVKAGEMRFWTAPPAPPAFAEVPQTLDVPQAGRLEKFEKTLLQPGEALEIHATYEWKGARK